MPRAPLLGKWRKIHPGEGEMSMILAKVSFGRSVLFEGNFCMNIPDGAHNVGLSYALFSIGTSRA